MQASTATTAAPPADFDDVFPKQDIEKETGGKITAAHFTWQLRNRDHNGLSASGAILKVGRKILVVRPRYLDWLYSQTA